MTLRLSYASPEFLVREWRETPEEKPEAWVKSLAKAVFQQFRLFSTDAKQLQRNVADVVNQGLPAGLGPLPWAAATAPTGWLLCDGSAVSRTTYASLFAVISTTYGVGDGSTTFNLPNMVGKFPLGKTAAGTGSTLGGTGGAIDHTHTGGSHALTEAELAAHRHGVNFYAGSPTADLDATNHLARRTGAGNWYATALSDASVNDGADAIVRSAGSGTAHSHGATSTNNPPFLAINFIIKT